MMRWMISGLVLSCALAAVGVPPGVAAEKNRDGIAVIIGNKDYAEGIPEVSFAHNDADAMKRFVTGGLGFRAGNIIDLRDATKGQLEEVFGNERNHEGKLHDWVRPGRSDVVAFYSGHGVPGLADRRGYLLPTDGGANRAEITGSPLEQHGLFTHHLLLALRGTADGGAWGNGDDRVTLGEAGACLRDEMTHQARRRFGREQVPDVAGDAMRVPVVLSKGQPVPPFATVPLDLQPVEAVYVTVHNANVRAAATVASSTVVTLLTGTEVYVSGRTADGQWLKVERDGKPFGFIYARLLRDKAEVERENAARKAAARRVGERFKDCADCPQMVVVPSGSFMMGSSDSEGGGYDNEGPRHGVTIDTPFAVGRFEVTFSEWDACVSDGGCGGYQPDDAGWGRGLRPVLDVDWNDAQRYVSWLSKKTGHGYRLLSEAEWEYVARAGTTADYHYGNDYQYDRFADGDRTEPVGRYAPNRFGLHDVHGNVSEWVEDCWNHRYADAPDDGRAWVSGECRLRVVRGGSWLSNPTHLRAAHRSGGQAVKRYGDVGFRVARIL